MQINSIGNFFNNIKLPKQNFRQHYNNYPNLAPLKQDTVSFSGKKKDSSEILETSAKEVNLSYRPNINTAKKISDESERAYNNLKDILRQTFKISVIDADVPKYKSRLSREIRNNEGNNVLAIVSRTKSPESIAEKMSTLKIRSKSGAKKEMNDIIGARIIVSGNSTKEGDAVLRQIAKVVTQGRLNIKEIKIHNQEDSSLDYISPKGLKKLLFASKNCEAKYQPRDSGYLAVHLITDEIIDGYNAEIQIMGLEVTNLKEIEDLCYKCSTGKRIDSKYAEIADRFKEVKNDPELKKDFTEYTKRAYANERRQKNHKKAGSFGFLPIPDDLNIPQKLDFNVLYALKRKIDESKKA